MPSVRVMLCGYASMELSGVSAGAGNDGRY
jgi:hypothetical protein